MKLYPSPQSIEFSGKSISFNGSFQIHNEIESLENTPKNLVFSNDGLAISISKDTALTPQAYGLKIGSSGLSIRIRNKQGLFYALQTLAQITHQSKGCIPEINIQDNPCFEKRGYMLDVSRCRVPKMDEIKRIIDLLASLKYNEFQLYTEHTFAYKDHKKVWENASAFTAEEIQEIDHYCKERFIELIPNQNSMGHLERWLRYPEYHDIAECPEGFVHPISGEKKEFGSTIFESPKSLNFIDSLYTELLPNFTSKNFNVGCDEPWEIGKGKSKDLADKIGKHGVYFSLLKEIQKLVLKRGYNMYFWADILLEKPELIQEMQDVTGLIWGYEKGHPFDEQCAVFSEAKLPFYLVPGTSLWNTICGRINNCLDNISEAILYGKKHCAKGILLTDWGDNGHHQPFVLSYPALIKAASLSWNSNQSECEKDYISKYIFCDQQSRLVECIYKLGKIPEHFSKKRINGTLLSDILFAKKDQIKAIMDGIHYRELEQTRKSLDEISSLLDNFSSKSEYAEQCKTELQWVHDALYFALQKALYVTNPEDFKDAKNSLNSLCNDYEQVWKKRSRIGGFDESQKRLKDCLN